MMLLRQNKILVKSLLVIIPVLVLFIAGYLFTAGRFPSYTYQYFLLNSVACVFAAFTAAKLRQKGRLPAAWLAFLILLIFGYAKFYCIALFPDLPGPFFPARAAPFFADQVVLFRAFLLQSVSFAALCASLIMFTLSDTTQGPALTSREISPAGNYSRGSAILSRLIGFLFPLLVYLVYRYKIGVLGIPSAPLPLHFSGLIFYSQIIVLPGLILSQIYAASKVDSRPLVVFGGAILFLWSVADAVLRGSKGSLLVAPLLVIFLWMCGGIKFKKGEIYSVLAAGTLALISTPVMAAYRICRLSGEAMPAAVLSALRNYSLSPSAFLESGLFIFLRIPGIETAIVVLGLGAVPLGASSFNLLFTGSGVGGYITQKLFFLPVEYAQSFASSFLAGSYLLAGYSGVIGAAVLVAFASTYIWRKLAAARFEALPVALSFFLLILFYGMTEGASPILLKQAMAAIVPVLICEAAIRLPPLKLFSAYLRRE